LSDSLDGMPDFGKEEIPLIVPDTSEPKTSHLCTSKNKKGEPCGFPKRHGSEFCTVHDTSITKEQRDEWRRRKTGGKHQTFRRHIKTKEQLLEILSGRFDVFLERFGSVVAPEVEQTLCEMARTYVAVLKVETVEEEGKGAKGWRMRGTA